MSAPRRVEAVLFDRDGTLIVNVPHNADPALVEPMPTARDALELLRQARVPTAVVSNQSVIGRGLATRAEVDATNARVNELLGPVGPVFLCPHAPDDGCTCRKPQPELVLAALARLAVSPEHAVFIGDMASDLDAARAAGVWAVLVPTAETAADAALRADRVAESLLAAVETMLG